MDVAEFQLILLEDNPVIDGSVTITIAEHILRDSIDFQVDYLRGEIKLGDFRGHAEIEYAAYPQKLQEKYFNYEVIKTGRRDSINVRKKRVLREDYEPLKLQVKGNKTVSISISDDEDFQLDQSLYLQISGEMSKNVNIMAQVTDSESPLTPEGNSRELSNLDRIFIRIYGDQYFLGFGDMEHSFEDTYFLDFSPQFEGLKAGWGRDDHITAGVGLTRSESSSIELTGIEGRQGPYWLSDEYIGDAVIVAGSEKIYLNGIELERGDDYSIDYSEGSVTFSDNNFISSSDRIYATCQFADENYRQSVYLADGEFEVLEGLKLGTSIYYQEDDLNNPLTSEFSEADLDSLAAGGDDNIWSSGVYETEVGLGEYILHPEGFYEYVGFDSTGIWNISFREADNGDYELSDLGYYIFAGTGMGEYLPGVRLNAPQSHGNYSFRGSYRRGEFEIAGEALFSSEDKNTKSKLNDEDNESLAGNLELKWEKEADFIRPYVLMNWRYLGKNLYTFDPVVSGADHYETINYADSLEQNEVSGKFGVEIKGIIKPEITYRRLKVGKDISQDYLRTDVKVNQQRFMPEIYHNYLTWQSEAADTVKFSKHIASVSYSLADWKLGYEISSDKRTGGIESDEENQTSLIFVEFENQKEFGRIYWESSEKKGLLLNDNHSETAGIKLDVKGENQHLKLNFAHREVRDSVTATHNLGELNYNVKMLELVDFRTFYRIRNLDFYPRIRELVYVGYGDGQYNEDGEEEEDGDYDWEIVAIDYANSQESTELTANFTANISAGSRYPELLQRMHLNLESAVSEQSTTDDLINLYLLDGSELMQDDMTVYGRQNWRGDLWFDIKSNVLKLRLTADGEERLDNRYQDGEEMSRQHQEIFLRWKQSRQMGYEFYLEQRIETDSRYDLRSESRSAIIEVKYSAVNSQVYACRGVIGNENDTDAGGLYDYKLTKLEIIPSVNWYPGKGSRLYSRLKFRYNQAKGEQYSSWQREDRAGSVVIWDISYDRDINKYVTLSLDYKGESYPDEDTHHEFKMEISAEF